MRRLMTASPPLENAVAGSKLAIVRVCKFRLLPRRVPPWSHFEAVAARDEDRAQALLTQHVLVSRERLQVALEGPPATTKPAKPARAGQT